MPQQAAPRRVGTQLGAPVGGLHAVAAIAPADDVASSSYPTFDGPATVAALGMMPPGCCDALPGCLSHCGSGTSTSCATRHCPSDSLRQTMTRCTCDFVVAPGGRPLTQVAAPYM